MPTAEVILPDKKVHRTVLDDPPQRLIQYLDNKLGLKQPLQASELRDSLVDILADDEARFERLTQDIYKIYEDYYARDGDPDGKVSLEEYREAIQKRLARERKNPDGKIIDRNKRGESEDFELDFDTNAKLLGGSNPDMNPPAQTNPGIDPDRDQNNNRNTEKDQEIAIYQLAIGALALFLLISIAR